MLEINLGLRGLAELKHQARNLIFDSVAPSAMVSPYGR
jgi:hypothetical protein